MIESDGSANGVHPDIKMAQIKRSLSGVFEKELGQQASVLEARVQDCVNLLVLRSVLREVITPRGATQGRRCRRSHRRHGKEARPVLIGAERRPPVGRRCPGGTRASPERESGRDRMA